MLRTLVGATSLRSVPLLTAVVLNISKYPDVSVPPLNVHGYLFALAQRIHFPLTSPTTATQGYTKRRRGSATRLYFAARNQARDPLLNLFFLLASVAPHYANVTVLGALTVCAKPIQRPRWAIFLHCRLKSPQLSKL